jgi:nucleoside-diphosphate-sugar epimerase
VQEGTCRTETRPAVILVTGSSGFIGSAAARRLAREHVVVGLDREGNPHPPPEAECVCVDLTSEASIGAALERVRYAYGGHVACVIHLAAYYDFSGEPSPKYDEITVRGTGNLLRGLRDFQVDQFIFSSTMLVHAPCQPGERIDEDWPLDPKWPYPQSKVRTEDLIRSEHGTVPIVVVRIAGVYDDRCHSIPLAQQMRRIFERQAISHVFPGDLSHGQAFLHLDDLVEAVAVAVGRRTTLPREVTLLVGEPETLSYGELQHELGQLIHGAPSWETREIPKALAKAGAWLQDALPGEDPFIKPFMIDLADDHFALDISRARRLLDWEPRRSLRATLPAMVRALKTDPVRWYRDHELEPPKRLEGTQRSEMSAEG